MRQDELPELAIIGSAALHALLLGALIAFLFWNPTVEHSTLSEPIQIESYTRKSTVKQHQRHASRFSNSNASPTQTHSLPSLADLGMSMQKIINQREDAVAPNAGEPDSWDLLNPDPKVNRFNEYVYNKVQGWLNRDAPMNTQPLYGNVKVKIWFTAEGEYLENETSFDAIDPHFKEVVARALRKSFSSPIPRPFLFTNKKFSIERVVVIRV